MAESEISRNTAAPSAFHMNRCGGASCSPAAIAASAVAAAPAAIVNGRALSPIDEKENTKLKR